MELQHRSSTARRRFGLISTETTLQSDEITRYMRPGTVYTDGATARDLGYRDVLAPPSQVVGKAFQAALEHLGQSFLATGHFEVDVRAQVEAGSRIVALLQTEDDTVKISFFSDDDEPILVGTGLAVAS